MSGVRQFLTFVRWDFVREFRQREAVINMVLFALLVLFLINMGLGQLMSQFKHAPQEDTFLRAIPNRVGGVLFWIVTLFAGTVGLGQTMASERESGTLTGILLSPVELGWFYLAKVLTTWVYIMAMVVCLLLGYSFLFNFNEWEKLPSMLGCLAVFLFGYSAIGVLFAAMTSALRGGGEVVLRLMTLPLLMPVIYLTFTVREANFGAEMHLGQPTDFYLYVLLVAAFDAIYLTAGFLVFPKIFEE